MPHGDVHLGAPNTATDTTTILVDGTTAIEGSSTSGFGVAGSSETAYGVSGHSSSSYGVYGDSAQAHGVGGFSEVGRGVEGRSVQSVGVFGESTQSVGVIGTSNESTGVAGSSDHGAGVQGTTGEQAGVVGFYGPTMAIGFWPVSKTGVFGWAHDPSKASVGVRGRSEQGRGGVFEGRQAQVRLMPSTASNHPSTGQMGDLFVDKSGRLWFCKGGTSWVQLA